MGTDIHPLIQYRYADSAGVVSKYWFNYFPEVNYYNLADLIGADPDGSNFYFSRLLPYQDRLELQDQIHLIEEEYKGSLDQFNVFNKEAWLRRNKKSRSIMEPAVFHAARMLRIIKERNYQVFAVLAGVRNGVGFAGTPYGTKITPIQEERGFPADFNKEEFEQDNGIFWFGDHNFGWVTAKELLDYDWDQPVGRTGVITEQQFLEWDGYSPITNYSGGVWGDNIITITPEQYRSEFYGRTERENPRIYVQVMWKSKLREEIPEFANEFVTWLPRLSKNPEDVRLIFGFDS